MVAVGLDGLAALEEPDRARLALYQAVFRKAQGLQELRDENLAVRTANAVWRNVKFK